MTRAASPYYPVVRIETPETPPGGPEPPAILTRVLVNGQMWPVLAYEVGADMGGWQKVTLTFAADVTIEHPPSGGPSGSSRRAS